jgi:DNA adenine methylase
MQRAGTVSKSIFYFVDPPFFHKAERLYQYYFTPADHRSLSDALMSMEAYEPWLLSYDSLPDVRALYGDAAMVTIDRFYTTSRHVHDRPMFAEAVVTNLPVCPEPRRLSSSRDDR